MLERNADHSVMVISGMSWEGKSALKKSEIIN